MPFEQGIAAVLASFDLDINAIAVDPLTGVVSAVSGALDSIATRRARLIRTAWRGSQTVVANQCIRLAKLLFEVSELMLTAEDAAFLTLGDHSATRVVGLDEASSMQAVLNAWRKRDEHQRMVAVQTSLQNAQNAADVLPGAQPEAGLHPELLLAAQIVRLGERTIDGEIVEAVTIAWERLFEELKRSPNFLHQFHWRKMEEIVAAGYREAGFQVELTHRSGDGGRDVIATKPGFLSVRILDQVKQYAPGNLVTANDVRALTGVLYSDLKASKAVITTTSDFAPGVRTDPSIECFLPTRLELRNGRDLAAWLADVVATHK